MDGKPAGMTANVPHGTRSRARRFPRPADTLASSITHPNCFLNHLERFSAGFLTFEGEKAEITPSVLPLRGNPPSPRGRLLVVAIKFAAMLKGVPLGELAANAVSRLRGSFEGSSPPLFHMEHFTSPRRRWGCGRCTRCSRPFLPGGRWRARRCRSSAGWRGRWY